LTKLSRREALPVILAATTGIASPPVRATESVARLTFLHVNDVYRIDAGGGAACHAMPPWLRQNGKGRAPKIAI